MSRNGFWRFAALLAVALSGVIALSASAQEGPTSKEPPVVVAVDLERVINGLDELSAMEQDLQQFGEERRQRIRELQNQFEEAQTELQVLAPGDQAFRDKAEEVARLRVLLNAEQEFAEQQVSIRRGEIFSTLFDKVKRTIDEMAAQRGFDLVLNNDSQVQVQGLNESQVVRQISSLKFLHAADRLDITEELITRMNNEWRAGVRQP